ncbi:ATP-binding protein [Temperatibacter marinus]|uniref:histidine kinase n=1 Tax=Temperatibacter marinus TaxID=1456591 RepID=A0AA52EGB6_9PROT|nr:ATP-binding protein [Temperatibacter marinus]WND01799.1 ATP-binding protein [Temperatibacter marinus]
MNTHLQLISQFAQDLIRLNTQHDLSWYVVEEIVGKLELEDCVIYCFDESKDILVQIAAFGEKQNESRTIHEAINIPLGKGITGSVALSKKSEIIGDILLDERYISDLNNMRSEIAIPIVHEGKLYGVIDCESTQVNFFNQDHLDFMKIIASMLGARLSECHLVNELKRHQIALSESEAKYRSLFEKSDDAMMLMSENTFVLCNESSARMFEYATAAEMETIHPSAVSPEYQFCGKTSFDKAEEMMQTALTEGYNRFEWIHSRKSGQNFYAEVTLTRILYDDEPGIFAIVRDITDTKNTEQAMLDALSIAEKANISKARFLANMSHELRTPLNAIIGFSDAISHEIHGAVTPNIYKSYVQDIHNSGLFLLDLINNLLELSSIDANELEIRKSTILIRALTEDITSYVGSLLLQKEMELTCNIEEAPESILADERALKQILLNLISNAIKFSDPKTKISMTIKNSPSHVEISVSDQGFGMPPEILKNITKRFDRGIFDPWNTAIEGSGLGLAIVEGLIALHNGKLSIESQVDIGSTFSVSLPKK